MDLYKFVTQKGLGTQILYQGEGSAGIGVDNPTSSLDLRLLQKMTERKPAVVGYDNTYVFLPEQYDRFPTVSMSHFFLADTLASEEKVKKSRTLIDLGCGSGFLGNYAARNFEGLQDGSVIFCDLFPESLRAAFMAYLANNGLNHDDITAEDFGSKVFVRNNKKGQLAIFGVGDVARALNSPPEGVTRSHYQADVTVAAPIYIPEICEVFPEAFELFGAVSKIRGADFYVAHSSLADKVVEAAAKETGAKLIDVNSRSFPLVIDTTDSRGYELEEKVEKLRPLGLQVEGSGDNLRFKHDLRVSKFSYQHHKN